MEKRRKRRKERKERKRMFLCYEQAPPWVGSRSPKTSPALGGLQIPRWLESDPLSAWRLGLAPATLEFWVRFPNERNQGKQAHSVLKYRVPHGSHRLVVSRSTCPPLSSPPHANSFVIGPAVIKHTHVEERKKEKGRKGRKGRGGGGGGGGVGEKKRGKRGRGKGKEDTLRNSYREMRAGAGMTFPDTPLAMNVKKLYYNASGHCNRAS